MIDERLPRLAQINYLTEILGLGSVQYTHNSSTAKIGGHTPVHDMAYVDAPGAAYTLSQHTHGGVYIKQDQNITLSFAGFLRRGYSEFLVFINPQAFTTSWPAVQWIGASAITANTLNMVRLWTIDGWATIYGEVVHVGMVDIAVAPGSVGTSDTAFAFHDNGITQYVMATETALVLTDAAFSSVSGSIKHRRPVCIGNILPSSLAVGIGSGSSNDRATLYQYKTNTLSVAKIEPFPDMVDPSATMAARSDNDYSNLLTFYGDFGVLIDTATLSYKLSVKNVQVNMSNSVSITSTNLALAIGSASIPSSPYELVYNWAGETMTHNSISETMGGRVMAVGCTNNGPGGDHYFFGGESSGVTDRIVKRSNIGAYSVLAATLPAAQYYSGGMAHNGLSIWGYRQADSFRFTIAGEVIAVVADVAPQVRDSGVIHGNGQTI